MSINRRRLSLTIASGLVVEAINKVSPLLILHHAQKTLGLAAFGWAQYGIAIIESLIPLVAFGYTNFAIAEAGSAEHPLIRAKQVLSPIAILKLVHALSVLVAFFVWQNLHQGRFQLESNSWFLILMLGSVTLDSLWFCILNQKLASFNILGGLLRICSLLAILAWVKNPNQAFHFLVLIMLPNALISAASGFYSFRHLGFARLVPADMKRFFLGSIPFASIAIILTLYERFDLFLIERWFGLEALGAYSGPARVVQSLIMLINSVVLAFYAEMVRINDRESLFKHTQLSLWSLMALATPIAFGASFVEKDALNLIFTHTSPLADGVFGLLSAGMIGNALIAVFGLQLLQIKGKPWKLILALILGFLIGPPIAWLLRDSLGLLAASVAVLASKTIAAALSLLFARPLIAKIPWNSLTRTLLAGLFMALGLKLCQPKGLIWTLSLGAIFYGTALIALNREQIMLGLQHPKIAAWRRKFRR
ncbi:MAG: oligosaccharide flippase family protein [Proteobacteria bacterium]|nr:oligosaccharide flippase family protein [Pseudomonadota bacterium]